MISLEIIEMHILSAVHSIYTAWGWIGVAVLLAFENATGVTPSEIILGLAGWMLIAEQQLPPSMVFLGGLFAAIGSVLGASIAYWVARWGGRPLMDKLARWVRIKPTHLTYAESQFQRWGVGLVLVGRVMPGIRTLISIPAGLVRMPFTIFGLATFIGAYIWCTSLIGIGYVLGTNWALISLYFEQFLPYLLVGGGIILTIYFGFTCRFLAPKCLPTQVDQEQGNAT